MRIHNVGVEKTSGDLAIEEQLAWKIAEVASQAGKVGIEDDVRAMVKNRLIDNAAIAIAAINERAVTVARAKALPSEGMGGATLYGVANGRSFAPEKAAFANAVAVRFLDQDDTYLAAEYSHPDDNISPILAVAQHVGVTGEDLIRGIVVAYETQSAAESSRGVTIFAPDHDDAMKIFVNHVAEPLRAGEGEAGREKKKRPLGSDYGFGLETFIGEGATRENLARILRGETDQGPPALLLTGSHGMGGFPISDKRLPEHQGALVCQDWPGWHQVPIRRDQWFAAEDRQGGRPATRRPRAWPAVYHRQAPVLRNPLPAARPTLG